MKVVCEECREPFEAKRKTARFCGDPCRSRARRGRKPTRGDNDSDLVQAVIDELTEAGRLESFHGRLAVQLARQVSGVDAKGVSGLSKELRTVMAAALSSAPAPAGDEPAAVEPDPEDEVEKARRRRDEARAAAAGRS